MATETIKRPKFDLTKEQALKILLKHHDKDDPYWEQLVDEYHDEKTDSMPSIYDVMRPLGVTEEEVNECGG